MKVTHMVRTGFVALVLLALPVTGTAGAHAQAPERQTAAAPAGALAPSAAIAANDERTENDSDTPWGP